VFNPPTYVIHSSSRLLQPTPLFFTQVSNPSSQPGTPKSQTQITKAIDVWALGVTFYCLLFGKPPFEAPNEFALYHVIPNQEVKIPDTIGVDRLSSNSKEGKEIIGLLGRLLQKDQKKRITLAEVKVRLLHRPIHVYRQLSFSPLPLSVHHG
jgi:serine/threonine protein kinase